MSVASSGEPGNGTSSEPSISADGRWVAFSSVASNFAPGDVRDSWDVFVHDREMRTTERISSTGEGKPGNGMSIAPTISSDGRWVAFWSWADDLVGGDTEVCQQGDQAYNCGDIFVYDQQTHAMERIAAQERTGLGGGGNDLSPSADGRYATFYSTIYDRQTGEKESVCGGAAGESCVGYSPQLTPDGRWVAFGNGQVILRDRLTGDVTEVSIASDGTPADGESGTVPFHEGFSAAVSLSADGRWVAFASSASNLAADDTMECQGPPLNVGPHSCFNVFVHDRETGITERVSVPLRKEG